MAASPVAPASGAPATGGASAPSKPVVTAVQCLPSAVAPCTAAGTLVRGGRVRVLGRRLDGATGIVFRGGRGPSDDVAVRAAHVRSGHFEARVPERARSGPVDVRSVIGASARAPAAVRVADAAAIDLTSASRTYFFGGLRQPEITVTLSAPAPVTIEAVREPDAAVVARWPVLSPAGSSVVRWNAMTPAGPAPTGVYRLRVAPALGVQAAAADAAEPFGLADHIFPIRGRHDLGRSDTNNFGGGRRHQGQDLFAACGTRLAAARAGTVKRAASDARSGNYVVIKGAESGLDYVYMHMRAPALVRTGQRVFTGQKLGEVGDSGNADGCHLHFELWNAPGWFSGGRTINPLPLLRAWDAVS